LHGYIAVFVDEYMLDLSVARKVFFSGCHHGDLRSFIDNIMICYDKFNCDGGGSLLEMPGESGAKGVAKK
jgi:hypothetical protein